MRQEDSKTIHNLQIKIRELQEQHNSLVTRVILLQHELSKVKHHTEYNEPELTEDEIAKRQDAIRVFKGIGGGQATIHRNVRTIDN